MSQRIKRSIVSSNLVAEVFLRRKLGLKAATIYNQLVEEGIVENLSYRKVLDLCNTYSNLAKINIDLEKLSRGERINVKQF